MENVGTEVGHKMRSAIKAKLMELGCYVDDELPDYIMVMVANKRTKSQMNDDLELFLNIKTKTFVEWLQIVLKKLKEVTVTNPEVYKKVAKRKNDESLKPNVKVKKERKDKKSEKKDKKQQDDVKPVIKDIAPIKSLTDDLPVEASKLSELRKIVVMRENLTNSGLSNNAEMLNDDSFDIPPLSEVASSNEAELVELEKRIKSVKERLGLQVPSDDDEELIKIKKELLASKKEHQLSTNSNRDESTEQNSSDRTRIVFNSESEPAQERRPIVLYSEPEQNPKQRNEHARIVFGSEAELRGKRKPVSERLGKKAGEENSSSNRTKIILNDIHREEDEILGHKEKSRRTRLSALKRLGVKSKVAIPNKEKQKEEVDDGVVIKNKEVPSSIKVKPRVLLPSAKQANKNLLLKAVAEAHKSIAQTPVVGTNVKPDALFTKHYRDKIEKTSKRKLSSKVKDGVKSILFQAAQEQDRKELNFSSDDDNLEYVPKPLKASHRKVTTQVTYVPSSKSSPPTDSDSYLDGNCSDVIIEEGGLPQKTIGQKFIITLDGIERRNNNGEDVLVKKQNLPILFKNVSNSTPLAKPSVKNVPDKLPAVVPPTSIKTKERCKYWPNCRQGDKCEFSHSTAPCKMFPHCTFGDKCLFVHPTCKFEASCTRKDCPYNHFARTYTKPAKVAVSASSLPTCKFHPNCGNPHCTFFHPKPCKYGKYCKNPRECGFTHLFPSKSYLTWRSTVKL